MNTSKLQKEFYAITPMIISLDFKRGNLKELWEKATDLDNDLIHIITNEPAYPKTDGYDSKQTILAITKLKTEFNHSMAEFYDELDSLQISTIEEFIRFSSS